jgi:hypothetical protein
MFHHVLTSLDTGRPAASLAETLASIEDFTCLNCLLATRDQVVAHARMSPDTPRPRYYTLWRGHGDGFSLVSSEPLDAGGTDWSTVPDGTAFVLRP